MDETSIKNLVAVLPTANKLVLSWVWRRCTESCFLDSGDDIFCRPILERAMHLLLAAWNALAEEHPGFTAISKQRTIIQCLVKDLENFEALLSEDTGQEHAWHSRHQDQLRRQEKIDFERVESGKPILIPHYFQIKNSPQLQIASEMKFQRVTEEEYEEVYGTPYRWHQCTGGIKNQIQYIDRLRQADGKPILLPLKFQLHYPGLTWDGKQSMPSREYCRKQDFVINGIKYRYVSAKTFIRRYGLPVRVNTMPVRIRIVCAFIDIFKPIIQCIKALQEPSSILAQAISECRLNSTLVVSMECSVIPNNIAKVVDILNSISPMAGSEAQKWVKGQFEGWILCYRKRESEPGPENPPVDLSWELFKQAYFWLKNIQNGKAACSSQSGSDGIVSDPPDVDSAIAMLRNSCSQSGSTPENVAYFLLTNRDLSLDTQLKEIGGIIKIRYPNIKVKDNTIWSKAKSALETCGLEFLKKQPNHRRSTFKLATILPIWMETAKIILQSQSPH